MKASAASIPSGFGTDSRVDGDVEHEQRDEIHRRIRREVARRRSRARARAEHEARVHQVAADEAGDVGDGVGNAVVDDEQQQQIDRVAHGGIGAADEKETGELHDAAASSGASALRRASANARYARA